VPEPWQLAALGAAGFIAGHYLLLRAASGRIGDSLGALVLEGTAALGIALAYAVGLRGGSIPTTRAGVLFAVLSGLCISVGSILLFFALRRGGPVASTGTIVLGGGVAISALLAPWLFREPLTGRRLLGVALGITAMILLATERASTTELPPP
jgi:bacterial/archaeal transporter family protein